MNTTTLQTKVQNAQAKVDKTAKTIERHKTQLAKKIALLEKASGKKVNLPSDDTFTVDDFETLKTFKWDKETSESYSYYWEACDVTSKMRDIEDSKKKHAEAVRILENWKEKLIKEEDKNDFLDKNTPQVIVEFLNDWKEKAYQWHVKRYEALQDFKVKIRKDEQDARDSMGITLRSTKEQDEKLKELELDYKSINSRIARFAGVAVLQMDSMHDESERLEWLNKTLEQEKRAKMLELIQRINSIVGTITDAKSLSVSDAGNLNGIIIGTKGKAKVETFGAGGWNIQCFHYRTSVTEIISPA